MKTMPMPKIEPDDHRSCAATPAGMPETGRSNRRYTTRRAWIDRQHRCSSSASTRSAQRATAACCAPSGPTPASTRSATPATPSRCRGASSTGLDHDGTSIGDHPLQQSNPRMQSPRHSWPANFQGATSRARSQFRQRTGGSSTKKERHGEADRRTSNMNLLIALRRRCSPDSRSFLSYNPPRVLPPCATVCSARRSSMASLPGGPRPGRRFGMVQDTLLPVRRRLPLRFRARYRGHRCRAKNDHSAKGKAVAK